MRGERGGGRERLCGGGAAAWSSLVAMPDESAGGCG